MLRILKPSGVCLIYGWAKDQKKDKKDSTYLKQNSNNDNNTSNMATTCNSNEFPLVLPVHKNRTNFQHADLLVPWTTKGAEANTFHRYYHVFEENELEDLIRNVDGLKVVKTYYDEGNWCVIFQKL